MQPENRPNAIQILHVSQVEITRALRRLVASVAARYVPFAIVVMAIGLILLLVPPIKRFPGVAPLTVTNAPHGTSISHSTAVGWLNHPAVPAISTGFPLTLPVGGTIAPGPNPPSAHFTPPERAGSAGTTINGVACAPAVRQLPWSRYSPMCVPAYHGDNGGATASGVTRSTITLTLRIPNSAQQSAIDALAGQATPDDAAYVSDLESYAKFFNTQFELYGRHVVLKTFQGQGDYVAEIEGQDLAGAQEDAATAHDLGGFADVSFPLYSSEPYEEDLASDGVIGLSSVYLPDSWFDHEAPYAYSTFAPTGTDAATATVNTICRRVAGMPAIFTSDPVYRHKDRVFGLISPDTPVYQDSANVIRRGLAHCGVRLEAQVNYALDPSEFEQQSVSAIAQMKAAGVTTLICSCDPLIPVFLSQAADQQRYFPEWVSELWWSDPIIRAYSQDQFAHALSPGSLTGQLPPITQSEAYRAYELGFPGSEPAEEPPRSPSYLYVAYYTLVNLFSALQVGGPNLNAQTFERAMFSLPPSLPGGDMGEWRYGNGVFDPIADLAITRWSPTATSNVDDKAGAWIACDGGSRYVMADPGALGPQRQLDCPPG